MYVVERPFLLLRRKPSGLTHAFKGCFVFAWLNGGQIFSVVYESYCMNLYESIWKVSVKQNLESFSNYVQVNPPNFSHSTYKKYFLYVVHLKILFNKNNYILHNLYINLFYFVLNQSGILTRKPVKTNKKNLFWNDGAFPWKYCYFFYI